MYDINAKYVSLGGSGGFLGNPDTSVKMCADGVGKYQHFQHGSIFWHPGTGAFEVHGRIREKWAKLGWERSFLGYPLTDETASSKNTGKYNVFQGGAVTWANGADEAFETHGDIRNKWAQLGFENGLLGFPATDETKAPDGIGSYSHFQNGSIYWKPTIGAHEVHGRIRQLWAEKGWEQNPQLGYPISDELPTKAGSENRYADFENGVLFFKSGSSKAEILTKVEADLDQKPVSMPAGVIMNTFKGFVHQLLIPTELFEIKGFFLSKITDYSFYGNKIYNRRYWVRAELSYKQLSFFESQLPVYFLFEVNCDYAAKKAFAYLIQWQPNASASTSSSVISKLSQVLNPAIMKPVQVLPKPGSTILLGDINILSVKVMPNGDLNVYIEPMCAVTTACMQSRGLGDNCEELKQLRMFRDNYVEQQPQGKKMVEEYYQIAPHLVNSINRTENPKEVYDDIYGKHLQPILLHIKKEAYKDAYLLCRQAVATLKKSYYK